jgi:magnesium transporter
MKLHKPLPTVTSLFRSSPKEIGLPPGSLIHVGEQKLERSILSYISYSPDQILIRADVPLDECIALKTAEEVSWINLDGLHDVTQVEALGGAFDLHPLAQEDILNSGHPPKFEEYDECSLFIGKMLFFDEQSSQVLVEQISLVLTEKQVLSFQERPGDVFDGVRKRLKRKGARIHQLGADYLAYALIDSIIDSYFHILEKIGDRLDQLENEMIRQPTQELLHQVHQMKGQLVFLRKTLRAMCEAVKNLLNSDSELIDESTDPFLRDLYGHTINALDTLESYRETALGLVELYMSTVSQRMNEVMQILTITASIFIPLTFIAGIYGMNFEMMPELKWPYGYPAVMGLMLLCAVAMLVIFKRKRWF